MNMKYATTWMHSIVSLADNLSVWLYAFAGIITRIFAPIGKRMPLLSHIFSSITPKLLFAFVCILSVLSQVDVFAAIPTVRICVIVAWAFVFLLIALKTHLFIHKKAIALLFPILIFDILILVIGVAKGQPMTYLGSPIVYSSNLCAFVFIVGSLFGKAADEELIFFGAKIYVICAVAIAVYTILTTFSEVGFSPYLYAYSRKNSLAPMIVTAICCTLFLKPFQCREFHTPSLILLCALMALLKSRANLIGLVAVLIIWYFCAVKDPHARRQIFLNVIAIVFLVLAISSLRELVIDNILFNHRADLGISGITSGRTDQITEIIVETPPEISKPYFTGNGYTYVESLPLAAVLSYGIFAPIFLLIFAFTPLFATFISKKVWLQQKIVLFLLAISVAFLLNGIFEERAPFGPGVTYFMLWFTSGFVVSCSQKSSPASSV